MLYKYAPTTVSYRVTGEEGISFAKKIPSVGCGRDGPFRPWALLRAPRAPLILIRSADTGTGAKSTAAGIPILRSRGRGSGSRVFCSHGILQMHPPLRLHHPWPSMQLACPGLFAFDHSLLPTRKQIFNSFLPVHTMQPAESLDHPCHPNHLCYRFRQPFQACPST